MNIILSTFFIMISLKYVQTIYDPYADGGGYASYSEYPHSVYITAFCTSNYMCGGSVLNQDVVLTAAHCIDDCEGVRFTRVQVKYGHEDITKMTTNFLRKYVQHHYYDEQTVVNDICLLVTKYKILLSHVVKRVIVMQNPPKVKHAHLAGWGGDQYGEQITLLKHTGAQIQKLDVCMHMGMLPHGVFCAGPVTGYGTADEGDSGSALIVYDCIQIGLVSFKVKFYSLVAYTNVSYCLGWIKKNSRRLVCAR